jgi:Protein of unknown function (DUF3592)
VSTSVLSVIALAVGGAACLAMLPALLIGLASRGWDSANGTIVVAHLTTSLSGDKEVHEPTVSYTYDVRGRRYVGERVYYGQYAWSKSPFPAHEVLGDYQPDMAVTVYFDPLKPERAVLRPGVHGRLLRWTWMALLLVAAGIVLRFV